VVAAPYKKDDLLNCWTSSSDISGYHADFNEGHGTVGAWPGARHGMLCVNRPLGNIQSFKVWWSMCCFHRFPMRLSTFNRIYPGLLCERLWLCFV